MTKVKLSKLKKIVRVINENAALFRQADKVVRSIQELFCEAIGEDYHENWEDGYFSRFTVDKIVDSKYLDKNDEMTTIEPVYKTGIKEIDNLGSIVAGLTTTVHSNGPVPRREGTIMLSALCLEDFSDYFFDQIKEYISSEEQKCKKFDYYNKDFRKLRLDVFQRDGEKCGKCGATPEKGLSLTIDHIKPVSKYPELAMDVNNLQVLCWECNQTKSNLNCNDYR